MRIPLATLLALLARDLFTRLTLAEIMTTVSNGRDQMPAFRRTYKAEDLHDVAAFIREESAR